MVFQKKEIISDDHGLSLILFDEAWRLLQGLEDDFKASPQDLREVLSLEQFDGLSDSHLETLDAYIRASEHIHNLKLGTLLPNPNSSFNEG